MSLINLTLNDVKCLLTEPNANMNMVVFVFPHLVCFSMLMSILYLSALLGEEATRLKCI